MIVRLTAIVLAAALLLIAVAAWADDLVAEPPGYRTENYRAPVPTTLNGARVLSTSETEAIWRTKSAAFIDVLPRPPKPKSLPVGTVWREQPRLDIPGSIWLPDTGYGVLAAATEDYLKRGLAQASGGRPGEEHVEGRTMGGVEPRPCAQDVLHVDLECQSVLPVERVGKRRPSLPLPLAALP